MSSRGQAIGIRHIISSTVHQGAGRRKPQGPELLGSSHTEDPRELLDPVITVAEEESVAVVSLLGIKVEATLCAGGRRQGTIIHLSQPPWGPAIVTQAAPA